MRPFSPPESTLTDLRISSPENNSRPRVARTASSPSFGARHSLIQLNKSTLFSNNAPVSCGLQQSGFADAVGADDGDALAGFDRDVDVLQSFGVGARVGKMQFFYVDRRAIK